MFRIRSFDVVNVKSTEIFDYLICDLTRPHNYQTYFRTNNRAKDFKVRLDWQDKSGSFEGHKSLFNIIYIIGQMVCLI